MPTGIYKHQPMSEKTKLLLSKALKGHPVLESTKQKIKETARRFSYWRGRKKPPRSAEHCRKLSESKKGKYMGKDSSQWKGGITPQNKLIRGSSQYRLWRESVYKRDDYTDQKYGIKGVILHPHHILNFAEYPDLRFDPNNGITLSKKAHDEFHKIYGKQHNTREQLEEFLNSLSIDVFN